MTQHRALRMLLVRPDRDGDKMNTWTTALGSAALALLLSACATQGGEQGALTDARECIDMVAGGLRPLAKERDQRFNGKVGAEVATCRGSDKAAVPRDLYKGSSQVDVHVGSLQIRGLDCKGISQAQGVCEWRRNARVESWLCSLCCRNPSDGFREVARSSLEPWRI